MTIFLNQYLGATLVFGSKTNKLKENWFVNMLNSCLFNFYEKNIDKRVYLWFYTADSIVFL